MALMEETTAKEFLAPAPSVTNVNKRRITKPT